MRHSLENSFRQLTSRSHWVGSKPDNVHKGASTHSVVIAGTGGDDTVVITAATSNSGTYSVNGGPAIAFHGITSLTFSGGKGNDNLIVHNPDGGLFAPAGGLFVNGGTQHAGAGDGLTIVGGASDTAIYTTDDHHVDGKDGSIVLSNGAVTATYTYTGLEPLANTGTAASIVFKLPAGADNAFLEDDGVVGNNTSQLRSGNGTFETTVFTHPTNSLTILSGNGDTVTVNLADPVLGADVTIGSLTTAAQNPNTINIGNLFSDHNVTLAATGSIAESGSDADVDLGAGLLAMKAGTGIGVGNSIETSGTHGIGFGYLEAQTTTGGIFLSSDTLTVIGGVTPSLTGLRVVTSGDINITAAALDLADTDGAAIVRGGSSSGNVTLNSTSDLTVGVNNHAVTTPGGSITLQAGHDIVLGSGGTDFDNDVLANNNIVLLATHDVLIEGDADIVSDAFGHQTGAGVSANGGLGINPGNVTISSALSTGLNDGASVGSDGKGSLFFRTGFGGANIFTNQSTIFSAGGNITIQSDSQDFQAGSSLSASQGNVTFGITTAPVNANLGSTAAGFNFSQAELDTITAKVLHINPSGNITISQSITLDPLKVPTLSLEASFGGAGNAGLIIDGTAGEQADLIVKNLALQAIGNIGAADDIDVQTSTLAFSNYNFFGNATPDIDISNTGSLTIGSVADLTASNNNSGKVNVVTTGSLTVAANVSSEGQLNLQTIDSAASGENLTVLPGVVVQSGGNLFLQSGDNLDLQAGSLVESPDNFTNTVNFIVDAHDFDSDPDAGIGATANLNGSLAGTAAGLRGGNDADVFNVMPSASSPLFIGGIGLNDTSNVNLAGTTNPTLTIGSVFGTTKSGQFTFDDRELLNFTEIANLNTISGPLTVNGTDLQNDLAVDATGAKSGSFTLHGAYVSSFGTFSGENPITISEFGVPDTATYGQVITADATHAILDGFSFRMDLPSTVAFRGEVFAWDGTKATGPALFESATISTSGSGNEVVTFDTNGITLTPGQQYVLFASTSQDQSGHSGQGTFGFFNTNEYSGGGFVFLNNGTDASEWTSTAWDTSFSSGDLMFQADFDASATVGFTGLTGLGFDGMGGEDTLIVNGGLVSPVSGVGGNENDTLAGGSGADVVKGGPGADHLDGAVGSDTADYSDKTTSVEVTLNGSIDAIVLVDGAPEDTIKNIENIIGGSGSDVLIGDSHQNTLSGLAGNDILHGGRAKDTLTGGLDADSFVFSAKAQSPKGSARDVITDFSGVGGDLDQIDLSGIDAKKGAGDQAFHWIGAHNFHQHKGELHVVKHSGFVIVEGDTNGDGSADFQIKLIGSHALTADDFIL